jgi:hypothetical protein
MVRSYRDKDFKFLSQTFWETEKDVRSKKEKQQQKYNPQCRFSRLAEVKVH